MRLRVLLLLVLLGAAARSEEPKKVLELTLSADKKEYEAGERPKFTASLKNVSKEDVYVLRALDGSDTRMRHPYYTAEATRDGERVVPEKVFRCGNKNSLKAEDYKHLEAGASCDPFEKGSFGCSALDRTLGFDKPGKYEVTLAYDADTKDDEKFHGDLGPNDTKLLSKVVRAKVVSNKLTLTVAPKK